MQYVLHDSAGTFMEYDGAAEPKIAITELKTLDISVCHHRLTRYLFTLMICRVGLYTKLFYAIIPPLFLCFCLTAIPTSCYIFGVF